MAEVEVEAKVEAEVEAEVEVEVAVPTCQRRAATGHSGSGNPNRNPSPSPSPNPHLRADEGQPLAVAAVVVGVDQLVRERVLHLWPRHRRGNVRYKCGIGVVQVWPW